MLSHLRIQNLAIVDELEVDFGSGLNVVTGETGAGKSIVLKAIELLTGRRASADLIRSGQEQCIVEGLFIQSNPIAIEDDAEDDLALLLGEEELLIRRILDRAGRSKISVNGKLITASMLQQLAPRLLDITGQHQQQTLLDSDYHLTVLDQFGVSLDLRKSTSEAYRIYADAKRKLETFLKDQGERKEYFRRISFERDELLAAELKSGKRAELEGELRRLASVETLTTNVNSAIELIEGGDSNLEDQFRSLRQVLDQLLQIDPSLGETAALIETASVQIDEAKLLLNEYGSNLEMDPDRLETLREQVAEVARLERKYSRPESELVEYLASIETELKAYESGEMDEAALRAKFDEADKKLKALEIKLSTEREKIGKQLSKSVQEALRPLGMKHAQFIVQKTAAPSSLSGADHIEFLLAANPGEPASPLSKVASGGELSRILLVLKTALNEKTGAGTQIFDEVDSGIGGAVAQIVGEKLRQVSANAQVILVTHSAQIAACADQHFLIAKSVSGARTSTSLQVLNQNERVQHIAGMLAGKKISSHFEQSAKELLGMK